MKFSDIDTPSGHIIVGLVLMGIGATFAHFGVTMGENIISAGLMTVGIAMKNQVQLQGSKPSAGTAGDGTTNK